MSSRWRRTGNGGWYLGGSFTAVRGVQRNNLAHLNASGVLTAWNPNADGEVDALAVTWGAVYVGRAFSSVGGRATASPRSLETAALPPPGTRTRTARSTPWR